MRRILTVALLALGGTFAMSGVAAADIGDVNRLSIDGELFGSASDVTVSGTVRCQATIDYGIIAAVAQDPDNSDTFVSNANTGATDPNSRAEGVGAFGPNFDPPQGISDDNPCSQSISSYDVVVTQNRDSGDFNNGDLFVIAEALPSAENGTRGPGPFIGDYLQAARLVDFTRNR